MARKSYHVISHTHWDREWYLPFETFRLRLVDLMDHLLEILAAQPDYVFHLDAQTVCLEDYLEIRPSRRGELREYIREGRLRIGPWYVQNDFYLASGESTVRNLLIGSEIAREFGRCDTVGYVPDQFGLIGQLPQLLSQFGLKSAFFGRGYEEVVRDEAGSFQVRKLPAEVRWVGDDGTEILGISMPFWYNNAQRFPADPQQAGLFLEQIEAREAQTAGTSQRLLMNGVDHLEAQEDLLPILKELDSRLPDADIFQSTLEDYVAAIEKETAGRFLPRHQGEMRNGSDANVLQGTLSSRSYLKRDNVKTEALVELQLEPLMALLCQASGDAKLYRRDELRYLWKLLLVNHAHDSLCGCSVDRVHQDVINRLARCRDLGQELLERTMKDFTDRFDRSGRSPDEYFLTVFNPSGTACGDAVTARIELPEEENRPEFDLIAPDGAKTRYEVISSCRRQKMNLSPINLPGIMLCYEYVIRFAPEALPPFSYRNYRVAPRAGAMPRPEAETAAEQVLENEFLRFAIGPDGVPELTDKRTGRHWKRVFVLEDEADLGHSYSFIGSEAIPALRFERPDRAETRRSPLSSSLHLSYALPLPEGFDFAAGRRSDRTADCAVEITATLTDQAQRLELELSVDNAARDHRLRLVLAPDSAEDFSLASQPFTYRVNPRKGTPASRRDEHSLPNAGVIAVGDLAVFNEGLFEYDYRTDGTLALTLLRCTGRMVGDTVDPTVVYSEQYLLPENQCLGQWHFRAALRPGRAACQQLENEFRHFLAPMPSRFDSVDRHKFTSGRPFVQDTAVQQFFYRDLPPEQCVLPYGAWRWDRVRCREAVVSALKLSEAGDALVLRVFQPGAETGSVCAEEALELITAAETDAAAAGCEVQIEPHKIRTFRLKL